MVVWERAILAGSTSKAEALPFHNFYQIVFGAYDASVIHRRHTGINVLATRVSTVHRQVLSNDIIGLGELEAVR